MTYIGPAEIQCAGLATDYPDEMGLVYPTSGEIDRVPQSAVISPPVPGLTHPHTTHQVRWAQKGKYLDPEVEFQGVV